MKAIFAESQNGYLAQNATDDMSWTPRLDKQIFKLLTYTSGGICVCSRPTYNLLPQTMKSDPYRQFIIAKRDSDLSLDKLNRNFPESILIGGPNFLRSAYDMGVIDTFIVTTIKNVTIQNADPHFKNPFQNELSQMPVLCRVDTPDLLIRLYKPKTR